MRADILDFFDIIPSVGFDVPFEETIDRFKAKGLKTSFSYADVRAEEHQAAVTIAKMMDVDLLADVKASLDDAIANGVVFRDWADQMTPMLQSKGWWGRKAVLDPLTGQTVIAQLGSPSRLQTIFRTNMASAYANGHWDQIEAQAEDAPYLLYDAIDDYRTRPEHAAWDGTVLPITNKWWKTHTPPCGFSCRCSVIQLDADDLEDMGIEVDKRAPVTQYENWKNPRTGKTEKVAVGVDPGFGQAQAKRLDGLRKLLGEKIAALPDDLQSAAKVPAGMVPPDNRPPIEKAIEEAENYVVTNGAKNGREFAVLLDTDTGETLLKKRGGEHEVMFTDAEVELMVKTKNAVLYHNHPSGGSLSLADLSMASRTQIKIVAISSEGPGHYAATAKAEALRIRSAHMRADDTAYNLVGRLFNNKTLTEPQASGLHHHFINTALDAVGVIEYRTKSLSKPIAEALEIVGDDFNQWVKDFKKYGYR
jgi:SPP1 gp7 family putative phage head morphogenesis protein